MADQKVLIKGGVVVSVDPEVGDLPRGDVLIEGSRISDVAPEIETPQGAEVIDASEMIVMPGFIDTHRHTWQTAARSIAADWTLYQYFIGVLGTLGPQYRPEDVYASNLLGTLEALDSGITTLLDWSHIQNSPEHTDAAIEGLKDSGSRAVFGYGEPVFHWLEQDRVHDFADVRRVKNQYFSSDDGLITLAIAPRGPEFTTSVESTENAWRVARDLGVRITVHVGAGAFGQARSIRQLDDRGLLGPDTTYIHGSTLTDEELKRIAETGGTFSIAPEVEMHMGHGFPPTRRVLEVGARPSISIDVCTGIGGDMFGAMRSMLSMQRALDNQGHLEAGTQPERLDITTRDVLGFATIEGARACGLEHKTGSLTPGKEADVVLIRTDLPNLTPVNHPVANIVLAANTSNVDSVFVAGRPIKRDGKLVNVDLARARRLAHESRDYLFESTGMETGGGWAPESFQVAD
jgi:5-methylthioadenosine/S-adenosylhomocysteine deaminase